MERNIMITGMIITNIVVFIFNLIFCPIVILLYCKPRQIDKPINPWKTTSPAFSKTNPRVIIEFKTFYADESPDQQELSFCLPYREWCIFEKTTIYQDLIQYLDNLQIQLPPKQPPSSESL